MIRALKTEFKNAANPAKAALLSRFFKTGKGEYAAGDRFLGLTVPQIRLLAKKFQAIPLSELLLLLRSAWHEERLCALLIMTKNFRSGGARERRRIYRLYLANTRHINNWDLVDLSAPQIPGSWLADKNKQPLFKLAASEFLWERRIAMVSCFTFIKNGESRTALAVAGRLLTDKHDLMHKAVGWMLRETGKRCSKKILLTFLRAHYERLPRTTLRYAIEHFSEKKRKALLAGKFT